MTRIPTRKRHQSDTDGKIRGHRRLARSMMAVGVASVTLGALAVVPAATSGASPVHHPENEFHQNEFHQTNLVSDLGNQGAQLVDPNLKNPWGLASSPTSPIWVSDNNAGVATVYPGDVVLPPGVVPSPVALALVVTVPGGRASTNDGPSPTGQVFNQTTGFTVTSKAGSGPAAFIFAEEAGQIAAWSPAADPIVPPIVPGKPRTSTAQIVFTSPTAVYKGLAIAATLNGSFLYASNFHDGTVDVFDTKFKKVTSPGGFSDPTIPPGYAPFGIQNIHGLIYVTYAMQDAAKHDDVAGPGRGFVDVYTTDGFLVERLVSRGALNSPWGMVLHRPDSVGSPASCWWETSVTDGSMCSTHWANFTANCKTSTVTPSPSTACGASESATPRLAGPAR